MRIGIGTALYLSRPGLYRLAKETLASIESKHDIELCGWVNHDMPHAWRPPFEQLGHLHLNDENNLSRAWNRSIDHLTKTCDVVFLMNLDIVLAPGALDRLVGSYDEDPGPILRSMSPWHFLERESENVPGIDEAPTIGSFASYPHFSAFMVDERLFKVVGPFDEHFRPAYNEDLDMHWRIVLAGERAVRYEPARFFHHGSATIRADSDLRAKNSVTHAENNAYFRRKWGHKPATADDPFLTHKMFRFPFDEEGYVGVEARSHKPW